MKPNMDLTGRTFDRWSVVSLSHTEPKRGAFWNCRCACGTERVVRNDRLRSGESKSCGCLQKELMVQIHTKHGMAKRGTANSFYHVWENMRARCTRPTHPEYKNYGGRGITFDVRWNDFAVFAEEVGDRPSPDMSLDRINNELGYFKENMRWASKLEQSSNTRRARKITFGSTTDTASGWARRLDVSLSTFCERVNRWGAQKAIEVSGRH